VLKFTLLLCFFLSTPFNSFADDKLTEQKKIPENKSADVETSNSVNIPDSTVIGGIADSNLPKANTKLEKVGEEEDDKKKRSILTKTLLYLPNRVFDILDIVRFRLRLGPGVAAGARVTEYVSANLGAYMTTYVGLPGPRQKQQIPRPVGFEAYAGGSLSVLNYETESFHPEYSVSEVGAQGQVLIVGLDAGIDPWEIVDLLGGFVGFDPRDDDL
jgi:hypothetical protein